MMMNQEDDTKVGPKQRYNTTAAAVLLLCSHPLLVKEKDGEKQATLHHSFLTKIQALKQRNLFIRKNSFIIITADNQKG